MRWKQRFEFHGFNREFTWGIVGRLLCMLKCDDKFLRLVEERIKDSTTGHIRLCPVVAQGHIICNCQIVIFYFPLHNLSMGVDPASFWDNLFLYHFGLWDKISLLWFQHILKSLITFMWYDICVINDPNSFLENFKDIYPEDLDTWWAEWKVSSTVLIYFMCFLANVFNS